MEEGGDSAPRDNWPSMLRDLPAGVSMHSQSTIAWLLNTAPRPIEDCRDAVRGSKNSGRYGGDPDRIGALGYSAGAHLACMLAVTGQEKAGNEIGTKIPVITGGGTRVIHVPSGQEQNIGPLAWGSREKAPKAYRRITARAFRQGIPPSFFHGDADFLVGMSGLNVRRNEEIGNRHSFPRHKGRGHFRAVFNSNAIGKV